MRKNKEGSEDTLLSKIYGSNQGFQGPICRFMRQGEVGREKPKREEKEEEEHSGKKGGLV